MTGASSMTTEDASRFEFGANWADFVERNFSQERVDISRRHLLDFLGRESLEGLRFLDIGCGSGLHSLAAWQAGARRIHSFDYDPKSVATTRALHRMANTPEAWEVMQGSVLDAGFMAGLPQADLVYSWGVLHHTGDVWNAIRQACGRVAPGGLLYIASTPPTCTSIRRRSTGSTSSGVTLPPRPGAGAGWSWPISGGSTCISVPGCCRV